MDESHLEQCLVHGKDTINVNLLFQCMCVLYFLSFLLCCFHSFAITNHFASLRFDWAGWYCHTWFPWFDPAVKGKICPLIILRFTSQNTSSQLPCTWFYYPHLCSETSKYYAVSTVIGNNSENCFLTHPHAPTHSCALENVCSLS